MVLGIPPRAQFIGGVWLPDTEVHLVDWMEKSKRARVVEGKWTYQYHKIETALKFLPAHRRRTAADIGAHVGLWSMWLVREFQALYAWEPVPWFADIFPANVEPIRPSGAYLNLNQVALCAERGYCSVNVPLTSTGAAHLAGRKDVNIKFAGEIEVYDDIEVWTLDDYMFADLDFLKIDVEGVELDVVLGGEETIRRCKPLIVVEQKGNDTAYGDNRNAAKEKLEAWGMVPRQELSGDWIMGW